MRELHGFNHGFDENDFILGKIVFGVELNVDFLDAFAPVDVAVSREVLHRDIRPSILRVVLRCLEGT